MKKNKIITILLLLVIFGYFFWQSEVKNLFAYSENIYAKIKIFTSILETVQRAYLEERSSDELIEDAINGMLSNLDPHTSYLSAEEFKEWNQNFEGYSGIGIGFDIIRNDITVMSVFENSPALKAGIHPGDKIIEINGESVIGIKRDNASKKLKGAAGSKAILKVKREGRANPLEFHITREKIVYGSITQTLMIDSEIGYIKIERFTSTTPRELEKALNHLESNGMKRLILDLRQNSGGYLNASVEVADKFIPGGKKIVYTKGRLGNSYQEFYATTEPTHPLYPLIVLIDHGSASASEIVAGAIQDLDRGLIIGKTSFGKGLVQSQYRFPDGSALLITTAKYYTPSGRPIQRDYFNKSKEEYYDEAYNDDLKNHYKASRLTAYKTLSGRVVYSGHGIIPDIQIKTEENVLSESLRQLIFSEERVFFIFAEEYTKKNPRIRTDMNYFVNKFHISEKMYQAFIRLVRRFYQKLMNKNLLAEKDKIKFLIKREMAYILWGKEARFRVNLLRDKELREAIKYFPKAKKLLDKAGVILAETKN
jgi:carboxyl-terminal processing protease